MNPGGNPGFFKGSPERTGKTFIAGIGDGFQGATVGRFVLKADWKHGAACPDGRLKNSAPEWEKLFAAGCGSLRKDGDVLFILKCQAYLLENISKGGETFSIDEKGSGFLRGLPDQWPESDFLLGNEAGRDKGANNKNIHP